MATNVTNSTAVATDSVTGTSFVGPFGKSFSGLTVVGAFAFLYAIRPYFLHKLIFNNSPFIYFMENMVCFFTVLLVSVIFVEIEGNISSTKNAALLISSFAYFLFYNTCVEQHRSKEIASSIELLKSTLPFNANIEELTKMENQLYTIQNLLGNDALHRIMLDAAIMRDHRCLYFTANPVVM